MSADVLFEHALGAVIIRIAEHLAFGFEHEARRGHFADDLRLIDAVDVGLRIEVDLMPRFRGVIDNDEHAAGLQRREDRAVERWPLLDFDYQEVRVAQAIIANSRQVFLAADHTKFGRNALVRLGAVEDVDALFTDAQPPTALRERIDAAEVALHVAGTVA